MNRRLSIIALLVLTGAVGCDSTAPPQSTVALTASTVRAERRLYDGAPPVIPHPPLNISCIECHTGTGKEAPPLGFAPANPHAITSGLFSTSNCRQCHVFGNQGEIFQTTEFVGLSQQFAKAERLYPGAPPVIPHAVFMRENCNACHSGPVARPEIRCTHPLRTNCRQCHVPIGGVTDEASLASAPADF